MSDARNAICNATDRVDEQVHVMVVHLDKSGQTIRETPRSAYGMTNEIAANLHDQIVAAVDAVPPPAATPAVIRRQ